MKNNRKYGPYFQHTHRTGSRKNGGQMITRRVEKKWKETILDFYYYSELGYLLTF